MATYANTSRTATAEETPAAQANSLFLQLVNNVPGVVHVEPFGGAAVGQFPWVSRFSNRVLESTPSAT